MEQSDNYSEQLVQRINECRQVLDGLESNKAWKIVVDDLKRQNDVIDNNWHLVTDDNKLQEFRITKFAVMHLINIKQKYEDDLKNATEELKAYESPEKVTMRDYDSETNME